MIPALIVLAVLLLVPTLFAVAMYNGLVSIRNQVDEAWSDVDTELKRRYDLIPNLVATVQGYAKHERELLERVTELRGRASANHGSPRSQAADESALEGALGQLRIRLEAYPDLKASDSFLALQRELSNTEDRIQAALRFYNGNVRENNNKVEQFPSNLVARLGGFGQREFFELKAAAEREAPAVDLGRGRG